MVDGVYLLGPQIWVQDVLEDGDNSVPTQRALKENSGLLQSP